MIEWAVEAGVDYITGETFDILDEALLALECIQKYGKGKIVRLNHLSDFVEYVSP